MSETRRRDPGPFRGMRAESIRRPHYHDYPDSRSDRPATRRRAEWVSAIDFYFEDRLEEAWELVRELGAGDAAENLYWYRLIEAEHLTGERSEIARIAPWLEFECIPSEIGAERKAAEALLLPACDRVAERLGWTHGEPTLITLMSEEVDGPWVTNPHGYCMDKEPYAKICLPNYLLDDFEELEEAIAHEYAHVVTLTWGAGHAPPWLEEAVSMLFEIESDDETVRGFASGELPWRAPRDLDLILLGEPDDDSDEDALDLAYEQALWIGRYLEKLTDRPNPRTSEPPNLQTLLQELGRNSIWKTLAEAVLGRRRSDMALRKVYGISAEALFREARSALKPEPTR